VLVIDRAGGCAAAADARDTVSAAARLNIRSVMESL